jgi:hypothetical protein
MSDGKFGGLLTDPPPVTAKSGFDALMHEVIIGWGYCGCMKYDQPLHVDFFVPPEGPVTADQFVEWAFLADNLNPNLCPELHRQALRATFVRHMGGEVVDAKLLQWSNKIDKSGSGAKELSVVSANSSQTASMSDGKFRGLLRDPPPSAGKSGYDALMNEVCVGWGYCGCMKRDQPLHVHLLIPPEGPMTADQFVEWVFLADDLNPNLGPESHRRALRAAFVKHMGSEVVDAKELHRSKHL